MKQVTASRAVEVIQALALCVAGASAGDVTQEWMNNYNGPPGDQNDVVHAIAFDSEGDVIAAGFSLDFVGQTLGAEYFVAKYDVLTGDEIWSYRYEANGPGNLKAMAVDSDGFIYVTGYYEPGFTDKNFLTLKLAPDGRLVWEAQYESGGADDPVAIALDAAGNVYVTGRSAIASLAATTVKYDPDGNEQWVATYTGPGIGDEYVSDLAVNPLTGESYVACGSFGGASFDFAIIKYSPAGELLWERRYDNPFTRSDDFGDALALDSAGNVVIAGRSLNPLKPSYDVVVIKYDAEGVELWQDRFDGEAGRDDSARDLEIDANDAIYLACSTDDMDGYPRATVVKWDAAGARLWATTFANAETGDTPLDLALDAHGASYLAGYARDGVFELDTLVFKLNPDGSFAWSQTFDGPVNDDDNLNSVAIDAAGRVAVGGTADWGDGRLDFLTILYSQESPFTLALEQTELRRDQPATFTVSGAQSGERVYYLYSFAGTGAGPCPPQLGGLCIDLLNPVTNVGSAVADGAGVAMLSTTIPGNAPLREVSTQAVIRRGPDGADSVKSNTVVANILP